MNYKKFEKIEARKNGRSPRRRRGPTYTQLSRKKGKIIFHESPHWY